MGYRRALLAAFPLAFAVGCAHPARLSIYDEAHRPLGYHWVARPIPRSVGVEYYGVDPTDGWTVYVGPDGVYYTFAHAPPITTGDLRSYWDPHDAPTARPGQRGQRRSSASRALQPHADRTRS